MATIKRSKDFTKPGTYTWTVPSGITRIKVTGRGGAGGGASGFHATGSNLTKGGQGCASHSFVVRVKPKEKISVIVGAGGAGGAGADPGVNVNIEPFLRNGDPGSNSGISTSDGDFSFEGGAGGGQTPKTFLFTVRGSAMDGSGGITTGPNGVYARAGQQGSGPGFGGCGGGPGDVRGGTGGNSLSSSNVATPAVAGIDAPDDARDGGGGGQGGGQFSGDIISGPARGFIGAGAKGSDGYIRIEW